MSLALLVIGIVFVVAAVRGQTEELFSLLRGDFTGSNNFLYWLLALGLVGAIGYIPKLKSFSTTFLVLVIVAILLSHKGFFADLQSAINSSANNPSKFANNLLGVK